jgi:rSAM/selenodomain-associated transferase 1
VSSLGGARPKGQRQLVVLARWPAPGRCKRRLAMSIGVVPASRIQARLLEHTLQVAAEAAGRIGARLVLALAGAGPRAGARWLRGCPGLAAVTLRLQGEGSLGVRMQRQLQWAARDQARAVVLIGADLPGLEVADLIDAFQRLEDQPLLLGPACDGGYWLIGQQVPFQASLLAGIPWGTDQVLASTLEVAAALGLQPPMLAQRADLDRFADLEPWC